ncbi:MAG: hypothetical protein ACRD1O_00615 [Terriglobia bacterium]
MLGVLAAIRSSSGSRIPANRCLHSPKPRALRELEATPVAAPPMQSR